MGGYTMWLNTGRRKAGLARVSTAIMVVCAAAACASIDTTSADNDGGTDQETDSTSGTETSTDSATETDTFEAHGALAGFGVVSGGGLGISQGYRLRMSIGGLSAVEAHSSGYSLYVGLEAPAVP